MELKCGWGYGGDKEVSRKKIKIRYTLKVKALEFKVMVGWIRDE